MVQDRIQNRSDNTETPDKASAFFKELLNGIEYGDGEVEDLSQYDSQIKEVDGQIQVTKDRP